MKQSKADWRSTAAALLAVLAAHGLFMALSGKWPWSANPYNSYILQAVSWLQGRLDVDYRSWLELAEYGGKYYVSFPPFPSYLLLPFAALFGENAPDGVAALLVLLVGAAYAVRLPRLFGAAEQRAVFLALFLYLGGAVWQITVDAWVWFLAQSCAFTLTLMAFTHAKLGQAGRAWFFLCAAVGCRPFQILCAPVLLWLLRQPPPRAESTARRLARLLPALLLALSFLGLNWARFGSPLEFGHNYLPEFVHAAHGQFHLSYVPGNLYSLVRLPEWAPGEGLVFPAYNGGNIFLAFPLLAVYLLLAARALARKEERLPTLGLFAILLLHLFLLCLHRTMGGAHFGHRYVCDLLPAAYLFLCRAVGKEDPPRPVWMLSGVLALWGLCVSFWGVLGFYAR